MTKRVTGLESFVAERVSVARELRGFNKRELAKRLGLAESSYNPYELKRIPFTLAMLERLVPILEMPLEWFLGVGELSDGESHLIAQYRKADPLRRQMLLGIIDTIIRGPDNA